MKLVAKYNTFKGLSTAATLGTPIITLLCCSDLFVHRSDTAMSAAGIFTVLIVLLLTKDKLAENWKAPSAFMLSLIVFVFTVLVEHIIEPMKTVAIATMISTAIDEFTFKQQYKIVETLLPEQAKLYKKIGFIFTTTNKLLGDVKDGKQT